MFLKYHMSQDKASQKTFYCARNVYMEAASECLNKNDSSHVINREFQIKGISTSNIKHYLEPLSLENTKLP